MSLPRLWATLAILLPALGALLANLPSVDLAYHLRAGGQILDGGGIPTVDTWTFTAAGQSWVDQQWGAQTILAGVYRIGGWTGLVVLRAALVGSLFALVFLACRLRGANLRRAAWLAIGAFVVSAVALGLRPQLFGMVLFAATLAILAARRSHPRLVWLIPPLVAVWANVHGSFFLGPLVVGLAWLEDRHDHASRADRLVGVAIVAAAAALLNPFGPQVWAYAIGLSTNAEVTRRITEWQPTSVRNVPGLLFFGSALAAAGLLARRREAATWPTLVGLGLFFLIGAYAIRGVAWWPPAAVFLVAPLVAGADVPTRALDRGARHGPQRLNLVIVGALVVVGIVLLPAWRAQDPDLRAPDGVVGNAPPGITTALRGLARPDDRLLNPQPWGSWFEFALPDLPVAIDSRIELFPATVWDDLETITSGGPGWQGVLDRWQPTIAVVTKSDGAFADRLVAAGWRQVFADDDGRVLVAPSRS
jgi:hypothetical protein